jgi:uroporphyrinogen-III synthase
MPIRDKLNGISVLVTRPAHQAGPLCDRIAAAGGRAIRFPLLSIRDLSAAPEIKSRLSHLDHYKIAIFISPNAVEIGLAAIARLGGLPPGLLLATVGQGSAHAMQRLLGKAPDIVPVDRFDSEGLLMLPQMQAVDGIPILILRGEGGRELLADTLRQRGAKVDYVELYRRERPTADVTERDWPAKTDIITITSSEALQNLIALTPPGTRSALLDKPLVVISERTAALARELGFRRPAIVAPRAGDSAILQALTDWVQRQPTDQEE